MKKRVLSVLMVITIVLTPTPITVSADHSGTNYARLLQYALYFYDANMCGPDVGESSGMTWRGACHTYDAELDTPWGQMDFSGGFHDAGDHIKFGVTASYAAMTMGLAYHEFKEAFIQTGQDEHMEIILNRFAEYLRKCTILEDDGSLKAYCYQVGDGRDHNFWGQPETQNKDTYERIAYLITPDNPGTDQLMAAAGALASNYVNMGNPEDLKCALALYEAALEWPKYARGDARDADKFYRRYGAKNGETGMWQDFGAAAAMWLYLGTNDISYRNDADMFIETTDINTGGQDYWPLCWDSVWQLSSALQGRADRLRDDLYHVTDDALANPADFVFVHQWGSNVMNAGLQFSGLLYDTITGTNRYAPWAKGQTDYIMGANPTNKCYVTGYAENSVKHTHHSGASGHTSMPGRQETRPQLNLLIGALSGGPINKEGDHNDFEDDYVGNEVGITYNAAFIGAVAGLYVRYGDEGMKPDLEIPSVDIIYVKPEIPPETPEPPAETPGPPAETPAPAEEEEDGNRAALYIIIGAAGILACGAGWYFAVYRPKRAG